MSTYEISKSSLLSLKAEILRKQEELQKTKLQNVHKQEQILKKSTPFELKNKGLEDRQKNDISEEEENLLRLSRETLEAKSRLYDKLTRKKQFSDKEQEVNKRYLVRFDKKNRYYVPPGLDDKDDVDKYPESEEEPGHVSDEYEPPKDPGEEWVEYIDCLGRTRKCMRKDLEFIKSNDVDLRSAIDDAGDNRSEQMLDDEKQEELNLKSQKPNIFDAESDLLSVDMRRELLRQQWEKEEEALRDKSDIHYQDILFNEARTHGVGYYAFSKDEEERYRQQKELKKLREETQLKQKKAQEMRDLREKQLASRAKAARNRKRARMGLPPETDEPEVPEKPKEVEPEVVIDKEKLHQEAKKEQARKKHIRPWDIGKKGMSKHYEHTQEEWVDKKRKERPDEFAPPKAYKRGFRSTENPEHSDITDKTLYFSTKKPRNDGDDTDYNSKSGNINPYKSKDYMETREPSNFKPVPIENEIEDFDEVQDRLLRDYKRVQEELTPERRGAEVPPPPTFEYYGPGTSKPAKTTHNSEQLQESIAAGLQFLRSQAEKKHSSKKHPTEMFLS